MRLRELVCDVMIYIASVIAFKKRIPYIHLEVDCTLPREHSSMLTGTLKTKLQGELN